MKQQKAQRGRSSKPPLVRGPYDRPRVAVSYDPERGRTHQSFKDECDITRIVDTYARTGIIPSHRLQPQYGDAPESTLFEAACAQAAIRTAEADGLLPRGSELDDISDSEGVPQGVPQEAEEAARGSAEGESAPAEGESSAA